MGSRSQASFVFLASLFFACSSGDPDFGQFHGTWKETSGAYESWQKASTHLLQGRGYILKGRDTLLLEALSITQQQGIWVYTATVPDQNDGRGIPFELVQWNDNSFLFSNPEHDFPQQLHYRFLSNDSLTVIVKGLDKNGNPRENTFNFTRNY